MSPDWRIIPGQTPVDGGAIYDRALGGERPTTFSAGVAGLEHGLDFGTLLTDRVLKTQRDNDPAKLAAEAVKRELDNANLYEEIQKRKFDNVILGKYGDEDKRTEIDSRVAQSGLARAYTSKAGVETGILNAYGMEDKESEIADRRAQTRSRGINDAKDLATIAGSDGGGEVSLGAQPSIENPNAPKSNTGSQGIPDVTTTQQEVSPPTQLDQLRKNAGDLANQLIEQQLHGKGLAVQTELSGQIMQQRLQNHAESRYNSENEAGYANLNEGLGASVPNRATGEKDPERAISAILKASEYASKTKDPKVAEKNRAAISSITDAFGKDDIDAAVAKLPKEKQAGVKAALEKANIESGDPNNFTDDQKLVFAAGLPKKYAEDTEATVESIAGLFSGPDSKKPDLNTAMMMSPYVTAATIASRGGKQPFTMESGMPKNVQSGDTSGPPPQIGVVFKGADGLVDSEAWAPNPAKDQDPAKAWGEFNLVTKAKDKLGSTLQAKQQIAQTVQSIPQNQAAGNTAVGPTTTFGSPNQPGQNVEPVKPENQLSSEEDLFEGQNRLTYEGKPTGNGTYPKITNNELGVSVYPGIKPDDVIQARTAQKLEGLEDTTFADNPRTGKTGKQSKLEAITKAKKEAANEYAKEVTEFNTTFNKRTAANSDAIVTLQNTVDRIGMLLQDPLLSKVIGPQNTISNVIKEYQSKLGIGETDDFIQTLTDVRAQGMQGVFAAIAQAGSVKISDAASEAENIKTYSVGEKSSVNSITNYLVGQKIQLATKENVNKLVAMGKQHNLLWGTGKTEEIIASYLASGHASPWKVNPRKFGGPLRRKGVAPGMENEPNWVPNDTGPNRYLTAEEYVGSRPLDPAKKAKIKQEREAAIGTTDPTAVSGPGGPTGSVNPTNPPTGSAGGGETSGYQGDKPSGVALTTTTISPGNNPDPAMPGFGSVVGPAVTAATDFLGLSKKGKEVAHAKIAIEHAKRDPVFQDEVNKYAQFFKDYNSIENPMGEIIDAAMPEAIRNVGDWSTEKVAAAIDILGELAGQDFGREADQKAFNQARRDAKDDLAVESPYTNFIGQLIGFWATSKGIDIGAKEGITALAKASPRIAQGIGKTAAWLSDKLGDAWYYGGAIKGIVNAAERSSVDTAAILLQTGDFGLNNAENMFLMTMAINTGIKMLGVPVSWLDRQLEGLTGSRHVDTARVIAENAAFNGGTKAAMKEMLDNAQIALKEQQATGKPTTSILAQLDTSTRNLLKTMANLVGARTAIKQSEKQIGAALEQKTTQAAQQAGLDKFRPVGDVQLAVEGSLDKTVTDAVDTATTARKGAIHQENSQINSEMSAQQSIMGQRLTRYLNSALKNAISGPAKITAAINRLTTYESKKTAINEGVKAMADIGGAGGSVEGAAGPNLSLSKKMAGDLDAVLTNLEDYKSGGYKKAETTYTNLDKGEASKLTDNLLGLDEDIYKATGEKRSPFENAIKQVAGSMAGTEKMAAEEGGQWGTLQYREITKAMGDGETKVDSLPAVANNFKFLNALEQLIKRGAPVAEGGAPTIGKNQIDKALKMIRASANKMLDAASAPKGLFTQINTDSGILKEVIENVKKQKETFEAIDSQLHTVKADTPLHEFIFGNKSNPQKRVDLEKAFAYADSEGAAVLEKMEQDLLAYDAAIAKFKDLGKSGSKVGDDKVLQDLGNTKSTDAASVEKTKAETGITDDTIKAIQFAGDEHNLFDGIITSANPRMVEVIKKGLGKDKHLIEEGMASWLKEKMSTAAKDIPDSVLENPNATVPDLLNIKPEHWKNIKAGVDSKTIDSLEKFLKQKVSFDLESNLFSSQGTVLDKGFGSLENMGVRRLIETKLLIASDFISKRVSTKASANRAYAVFKDLSNPDPAKVNELFERVVGMMEDNPEGMTTVKKALPSQTRQNIETFIKALVVTNYGLAGNAKDRRRQKNTQTSIEALEKVGIL